MTDEDAGPSRVDVIVAGATPAGRLAARHLAAGGAGVLLCGPDATAAPGLVYAGVQEHPARVIASIGRERGAELYAFARRSVALLGARPVEQVWVKTLATEPVAQSLAACLDLGLAARALDREALAALGIEGDEGFAVGGDGLVEGFVREPVAAPVTGVRRVADGLRVAVAGREVACELLILADGLAAPILAPTLADVLWPVREQATVFAGRGPQVSGRAGHGYTFFTGDADEVLVGGCRWAVPHLEVGETEALPRAVVGQRIAEFAARLGVGEVLRSWAWIEAWSCDGLPVVGPLPAESRIIACAGTCGSPWGFGPAMGQAVAEGLLRDAPTPTPTLLSPSRFVP